MLSAPFLPLQLHLLVIHPSVYSDSHVLDHVKFSHLLNSVHAPLSARLSPILHLIPTHLSGLDPNTTLDLPSLNLLPHPHPMFSLCLEQ